MTTSEFKTAVRLALHPLVQLVWHQLREFPDREGATSVGDVDFASVAKAMGAAGFPVSDAEFPPTLEHVLGAKRPAVIDIVVSPLRLDAWENVVP